MLFMYWDTSGWLRGGAVGTAAEVGVGNGSCGEADVDVMMESSKVKRGVERCISRLSVERGWIG
jgi:hypothetical protein